MRMCCAGGGTRGCYLDLMTQRWGSSHVNSAVKDSMVDLLANMTLDPSFEPEKAHSHMT